MKSVEAAGDQDHGQQQQQQPVEGDIVARKITRLKVMYDELFAGRVADNQVPEPHAALLANVTTVPRKTPRLHHQGTQTPRVRLIDRVEYALNVRIDKNERIRILCLMRDLCDPLRQKGKRFKESHDFKLVYEDLFVPEQITYAYKMSRPSCVVCNRVIQVGEERCKYSVANALNTHANCEKCGTHVYCLPCFVVLESTVIPGYQSVCFGTLLTQRGGCRQISAIEHV